MALLALLLAALLFANVSADSQSLTDESTPMSTTDNHLVSNEIEEFMKSCMSLYISEEACLEMVHMNPQESNQIISKRATKFASWGGKRAPTEFSNWGGKRGQSFASWGGKRLYETKGPAFSSWGGKRSPSFSSWGGKRSNGVAFEDVENIPKFPIWIEEDPKEEEKRNRPSWEDKRENENIPIKSQDMSRRLMTFSSWGGKRASEYNELKPFMYLGRCGYSWPSRWGGKRTVGFSSWGGKRSEPTAESEPDNKRIKRESNEHEDLNSESKNPNSTSKNSSTESNREIIRTKKWISRPLRWTQNWYGWSGKRASEGKDNSNGKDIVRFSAWGGKRSERSQNNQMRHAYISGNPEERRLLDQSRASRRGLDFYAWGGKRSKIQ